MRGGGSAAARPPLLLGRHRHLLVVPVPAHDGGQRGGAVGAVHHPHSDGAIVLTPQVAEQVAASTEALLAPLPVARPRLLTRVHAHVALEVAELGESQRTGRPGAGEGLRGRGGGGERRKGREEQ